jgi:hypothetical protein
MMGRWGIPSGWRMASWGSYLGDNGIGFRVWWIICIQYNLETVLRNSFSISDYLYCICSGMFSSMYTLQDIASNNLFSSF